MVCLAINLNWFGSFEEEKRRRSALSRSRSLGRHAAFTLRDAPETAANTAKKAE